MINKRYGNLGNAQEVKALLLSGNTCSVPGTRIWIIGSLIAFGCFLSCFCSVAATAEDDLLNTGEDITRPLNRFDVRLQAKSLPDVTESGQNFDNIHAETLTLRTDWVLSSKPDQLALRFDLPWVWSNKPNPKNTNGATQSDLGDLLSQAIYVHTFNGRWAAGTGMQVIAPTATNQNCGAGKWQLAPTVGVRASLPEITDGSYVGVVARQFASVAGDTSRGNVNYTSIQPQLNLQFPDVWFINISPNIRCENDTGKWFVPLDLMLGKKFGKHCVASLEYQYGLITAYKQYIDWVEFRLGYFF